MTTITLDTTDRPTSTHKVRSLAKFIAGFTEFCEGAREGKEIEARYRTYARLSQPDLAELGMTRAEIYRAALVGRPV